MSNQTGLTELLLKSVDDAIKHRPNKEKEKEKK